MKTANLSLRLLFFTSFTLFINIVAKHLNLTKSYAVLADFEIFKNVPSFLNSFYTLFRPLKLGMTCWAINLNFLYKPLTNLAQLSNKTEICPCIELYLWRLKMKKSDFSIFVILCVIRGAKISQKECTHLLPRGPGFRLGPSKLFYHIPVARKSTL